MALEPNSRYSPSTLKLLCRAEPLGLGGVHAAVHAGGERTLFQAVAAKNPARRPARLGAHVNPDAAIDEHHGRHRWPSRRLDEPLRCREGA